MTDYIFYLALLNRFARQEKLEARKYKKKSPPKQVNPVTWPWPADSDAQRIRELEQENTALRQELESLKERKDVFKTLWHNATRDFEAERRHLWQERRNNQVRITQLMDEITELKSQIAQQSTRGDNG